MSDNKHYHGSMYGKGYYIALILCAVAIGITSYVYHRTEAGKEPEQAALEASAPLEADVEVLATEPKTSKPVADNGETQSLQPRTLKTASPVAGQEVFG